MNQQISENGREENDLKKKESRPFSIYWIYLIILIAIILFNYLPGRSSAAKSITWQEFKQDILPSHDVAKIDVVNKEIAQVYIKPESLKKEKYKDVAKGFLGSVNKGPHYYFSVGSVEVFDRQLEEAEAGFSEKERIPVTYTTV
ncbi:MAG: ATP-dependent metallopeptidase FtsH/Yme1/Tma family protein, partial [Bacteroidota bacterium]|nr:ATP-dependent metallopeptidase FtsH/Yme1/Tma family protein [Bacteroidota bacterium]